MRAKLDFSNNMKRVVEKFYLHITQKTVVIVLTIDHPRTPILKRMK